jgi:hypothetical protein
MQSDPISADREPTDRARMSLSRLPASDRRSVRDQHLDREEVRRTRPVAPKSFRLAGGTGKHHDVFFCEACGTTLWSRYHIVPSDCLFVRAGTLDTPEAVRPDVHIHMRSKLPWLNLPDGVPAFQTGYKIDEVWSAESKERLRRNYAGQA